MRMRQLIRACRYSRGEEHLTTQLRRATWREVLSLSSPEAGEAENLNTEFRDSPLGIASLRPLWGLGFSSLRRCIRHDGFFGKSDRDNPT
jgi:hypothetical protein